MAAPQIRRIFQVITPSHMSGAEMQLLRLTKQMQGRGHILHTASKKGSSANEEFRVRGIDVEPLAIGGKINITAIPILAAAARRFKADLIQSTLSSASWWTGWLERFGGPPSVGHVQGFTSAAWHRGQSHLIAVSQAVKDDLVTQGIAADKITVMHNALSPSEFVPKRSRLDVRKEFGADDRTPVIGSFGHMSEKKGYLDLFPAIPTVLKRYPDAQFWVVGVGKLKDQLESYARENGFLGQVRFTGYRRDAADLMSAIDVMALPSHREPCALVYVEAALMEKPIVACRAGGAPESIAEGQTGLLVPVKDSAAIARAILNLLDNRSQAAAMGRAGRERALDVFSWERCIRTQEEIWTRVLDSRATSRRAA